MSSNNWHVEDIPLSLTPRNPGQIDLTTVPIPIPPQYQTRPIFSYPDFSSESESSRSTTQNTHSYLNIKLAIDLIPQFDGKQSLTKFIKQAKLAHSRVKPEDRLNLLILICNKIKGVAENLIAHRPEPENLDGLIQLLKSAFPQTYDIRSVNAEFINKKQKDDETADVFGARVSEILQRALIAAHDQFDETQVQGVEVMLTQTAITSFAMGLCDRLISTIVQKENPKKLEIAITLAADLERTNKSRNELFHHQPRVNNHPRTKTQQNARVNKLSQEQTNTQTNENENDNAYNKKKYFQTILYSKMLQLQQTRPHKKQLQT